MRRAVAAALAAGVGSAAGQACGIQAKSNDNGANLPGMPLRNCTTVDDCCAACQAAATCAGFVWTGGDNDKQCYLKTQIVGPYADQWSTVGTVPGRGPPPPAPTPPPAPATPAPPPTPAPPIPTCGDYDGGKAYAWLKQQGCTEAKKNSCPGGLGPDDGGCTDSAYIARALAAGGSVPLNADDGNRDAYRKATIGGVLYNLEEAEDTGPAKGLKALLTVLGWASTGGSPDLATTAAGSVVFTTAFAHSGGAGLPCFAMGGGRFTCHESPCLYGPQCNIGGGGDRPWGDLFSDPTASPPTAPDVWACAGAPATATQTPAWPAPKTPPACEPAECHAAAQSAYFVCQLKAGVTGGDAQGVLDYCCSGVGPDCGKMDGCGIANTVVARANWCVAEYYRIQCPHCIVDTPAPGGSEQRCDFGGKAALVPGPLPCANATAK